MAAPQNDGTTKPRSHLSGKHAFTTMDVMDPRFGEIDRYTLKHLQPEGHEISRIVREAADESARQGLPDMAASPTQAKFLGQMAYSAKARRILEVGTLGGISSIWLAHLNPQAHITTVEYQEHHAKVARKNIENAGLADRVEVLRGAGVDVVRDLEKEVRSGAREKFGFTFIDADKGNNWTYFDLAASMSVSGAPIVVDNIVRSGLLVDPARQNEEAAWGPRKVIEKAGKDERVMGVVIQMVDERSWDGQLVAVVK